jgi:hypothetical protein
MGLEIRRGRNPVLLSNRPLAVGQRRLFGISHREGVGQTGLVRRCHPYSIPSLVKGETLVRPLWTVQSLRTKLSAPGRIHDLIATRARIHGLPLLQRLQATECVANGSALSKHHPPSSEDERPKLVQEQAVDDVKDERESEENGTDRRFRRQPFFGWALSMNHFHRSTFASSRSRSREAPATCASDGQEPSECANAVSPPCDWHPLPSQVDNSPAYAQCKPPPQSGAGSSSVSVEQETEAASGRGTYAARSASRRFAAYPRECRRRRLPEPK